MTQSKAENERADVLVVGGGPAGLTAAIALASAGIATALIAPRRTKADHRTTALLAGSVNALEALGIWTLCKADAAPLRVMRIVDDTGRLWRAPEVKFDCAEIDLDAFGYNVENEKLIAALEQRTRELPALAVIEDAAQTVNCTSDRVTITTSIGRTLAAPLLVGADGRNSLCRAAAGITVDTRNYPQSALTVTFAHSRPHHDVSTEFHTPSGPFTVVPLRGAFPGEVGTGSPSGNATEQKLGQRSSLVWVLDPREAGHVAELDDAALSDEIERRSHSILGKIAVEPGRGLFPLAVATARSFGANRVALVGEAAHVVPPIGAQGLNLGLRDAATISELVIDAHRAGQDIGADDLLARYHDRRSADAGSRTLAIDLLNRSLLSDFLPAQGARGLGLYMIDRIGPLRRSLMREGVMPAASQPRLMRGELI
ncbi:MAG: UbiH/UbiF family hydroxylase [Pseudolabrys sp.]